MAEAQVIAAHTDGGAHTETVDEDGIREDVVVEGPEEFEEPEAEAVHCRHCGAESLVGSVDSDWLCAECGRYQDSAVCPVCKQPTRLSLLPNEHQPEAHSPKRRRKSHKEG